MTHLSLVYSVVVEDCFMQQIYLTLYPRSKSTKPKLAGNIFPKVLLNHAFDSSVQFSALLTVGNTANYCIVIAQLYSKGECHGIHSFIVQVRDEDTHMPLPGIKVGEIGVKMGLNAVNNGFLGFENVRIPRNNMLMKYAKVLEVRISYNRRCWRVLSITSSTGEKQTF